MTTVATGQVLLAGASPAGLTASFSAPFRVAGHSGKGGVYGPLNEGLVSLFTESEVPIAASLCRLSNSILDWSPLRTSNGSRSIVNTRNFVSSGANTQRQPASSSTPPRIAASPSLTETVRRPSDVLVLPYNSPSLPLGRIRDSRYPRMPPCKQLQSPSSVN
jgi:hypothetical protein